MSKIIICASFGLFPDDHIMGTSFNYSNFDFLSLSGSVMTLNETQGEIGLVIPRGGVIAKSSAPANKVTFRVGIFDGTSIKITAKDSTGAVVTFTTITGHNTFIDSSVSGQDISTIEFDTTGSEELLVKFCFEVSC